MHLDSLYQSIFDAGLHAYRAGVPRPRQPWPDVEVNPTLVEFWHCGWDTGAWETATRLGARAAYDDPCPYGAAEPQLAAAWARGWHGTHGQAAIGMKKPRRA